MLKSRDSRPPKNKRPTISANSNAPSANSLRSVRQLDYAQQLAGKIELAAALNGAAA
jgi:hypothetical protein